MSSGDNGNPTLPADRDTAGRFKSGNRGNMGGNPAKRRERVRSRALKMLFDELLKDDAARLQSIVAGWVADAKESQTARRHLLDRILGAAANSESQHAIERIERQVVKLMARGGGKC